MAEANRDQTTPAPLGQRVIAAPDDAHIPQQRRKEAMPTNTNHEGDPHNAAITKTSLVKTGELTETGVIG